MVVIPRCHGTAVGDLARSPQTDHTERHMKKLAMSVLSLAALVALSAPTSAGDCGCPTFKLPKMELPKVCLPKLELPKLCMPKINMPKLDLCKSSSPKCCNAKPSCAAPVAKCAPCKPACAPKKATCCAPAPCSPPQAPGCAAPAAPADHDDAAPAPAPPAEKLSPSAADKKDA